MKIHFLAAMCLMLILGYIVRAMQSTDEIAGVAVGGWILLAINVALIAWVA